MVQKISQKNTRGAISSPGSKPPQEELESKVLQIARVARVMAGGRRFSFQAIVAVGDLKGRVGLGVAKGRDVAIAVEKATRVAKKNLITVPLIDGTVPREVEAKYSSARLVLRPARRGRGIIAGGSVRAICMLAGIQDVSAKILSRSSNRLNNARVAIEALRLLANRFDVRKRFEATKIVKTNEDQTSRSI